MKVPPWRVAFATIPTGVFNLVVSFVQPPSDRYSLSSPYLPSRSRYIHPSLGVAYWDVKKKGSDSSALSSGCLSDQLGALIRLHLIVSLKRERVGLEKLSFRVSSTEGRRRAR